MLRGDCYATAPNRPVLRKGKPGQAPQTDYFDETVTGLALRVGAKRKT